MVDPGTILQNRMNSIHPFLQIILVPLILFFKSTQCKTASAVRKWLNSVPKQQRRPLPYILYLSFFYDCSDYDLDNFAYKVLLLNSFLYTYLCPSRESPWPGPPCTWGGRWRTPAGSGLRPASLYKINDQKKLPGKCRLQKIENRDRDDQRKQVAGRRVG